MKSFLLILALAATCFALPTFTPGSTFELPGHFKLASETPARGLPAHTDASLLIHIAIRQRNVEALNRKFHSVSNPENPDYTKYLTRQELKDLVSPTEESIAAVTKFLLEQGISNYEFTHSNDFVRFKLSIAEIERIFKVTLFTYRSIVLEELVLVRSTTRAFIPAELSEHIDFVHGFNHFPIVKDKKAKLSAPTADNANVTPDVIHNMYSVNETFTGRSNASQAVAEFQGQSYSPSDLSKFLSKFNLPAQTARAVIGPNTGIAHIEANLDIQYIIAASRGIPTDFYIESGEAFNLLTWITAIEGNSSSALVWSVSYGEDLSTQTVADVQRLDTEFKKAAVLGYTIIFASGDSGVYSRTGGYTKFHPSFPACMSSVISVGATVYNKNGTETISTDWSGGGMSLSNYIPGTDAPWQTAAVNAYFNSGIALPASSYYDRNGRGFPDVSSFGLDFEIFEYGFSTLVSGTSAAAPTFAGVFSLANDARIASGKAPLGFPGYFLYNNPQAFRDITLGNNADGHTNGFLATKGWDPVTGLGTPNYGALKAAALAA